MTGMSLSIECNGYSLGWLPDTHCVYEQLQRSQIPILNEFYRSAILKIPIGSIEKDTRMGLVAGIKINDRHPDPVKAAKFALQAAGIGILANSRSLAPDGLCDHADGDIQLPRNPSP